MKVTVVPKKPDTVNVEIPWDQAVEMVRELSSLSYRPALASLYRDMNEVISPYR